MEEQITRTIQAPRVTLKKSTMKSERYGWEISTSDNQDLTEIVERIEEADKLIRKKFKRGIIK